MLRLLHPKTVLNRYAARSLRRQAIAMHVTATKTARVELFELKMVAPMSSIPDVVGGGVEVSDEEAKRLTKSRYKYLPICFMGNLPFGAFYAWSVFQTPVTRQIGVSVSSIAL